MKALAAQPVLTSVFPAPGSTNVVSTPTIVLEFSAPVRAGSGTITICDGITQTYMGLEGWAGKRLVGFTDKQSFSITDSKVRIAGNTVTITLTQPLRPGLRYSLTLSPGALVDAAGHAFDGLAESSRFQFRTGKFIRFNTAGGDVPPNAEAFITTHAVRGPRVPWYLRAAR